VKKQTNPPLVLLNNKLSRIVSSELERGVVALQLNSSLNCFSSPCMPQKQDSELCYRPPCQLFFVFLLRYPRKHKLNILVPGLSGTWQSSFNL
jgi:hypothetical protein